jgi:fluoride exporter
MGARRLYSLCSPSKYPKSAASSMKHLWPYFLVFIGGGAGSMARFLLSQLFNRASAVFHWGTFGANMIGCLLIGLFIPLLSKNPQSSLFLLAVAGFCGGFTTFSTLSWESLKLLEKHGFAAYLLYVGLSIFLGLLLTYGGYRLALQAFKA